MNAVNPVMQQALAAFAPPSALVDYHQALKTFDWSYEWSDDHSVWAKGNNALARLRKMQRQVDPDGTIWKTYQPAGIGIPGPVVVEVA